MGLYSGNGYKRSVDVQAILDSDVELVRIGTPNVSQFGWTANDLTSVRDVLTYVKAAIEAAEIAQNAAELSSANNDRIEALDAEYQKKLIDIDTAIQELKDMESQSGVLSFNGRTGVVAPRDGDYTVSQVSGAVPDSRTINGQPLTGDITVTADTSSLVPNSRTINSKPLTSDVVLGVADISGAVPSSRTVNGKPLTGNISLTAFDVGAVSDAYTKSESDSKFATIGGSVPSSRTVNGKSLINNITLNSDDIPTVVPVSRTINGKPLTGDVVLTPSDIGVSSDVYTKTETDALIAPLATSDSVSLKADVDSPTLTGIPRAPSAAVSTTGTQIATVDHVRLKMNSFGLGSTAVNSIADLNTALTTGSFRYTTTTSNIPLSGASGTLAVVAYGGSYVTQTAISIQLSDATLYNRIFTRTLNNGTWGNWEEVYTTKNKPNDLNLKGLPDSSITDINQLGASLTATSNAGIWNMASGSQYNLTNMPEANAGILEVYAAGAFNCTQRYYSRYGTCYVRSATQTWTAANPNVWTDWYVVGDQPIRTYLSTDLNAVLTPGTYSVTATTGINLPLEITGILTVKIRLSTNSVVQTFSSIVTAAASINRTWTRTLSGATWSTWKELAGLDSPVFTGFPAGPTAGATTSNTQLATTAHVTSKMAAAGIGGTGPSVSDLNTISGSKLFCYTNVSTNTPIVSWGTGEHVQYNATYATQNVTTFHTTDATFSNRRFSRYLNNGTWSDWIEYVQKIPPVFVNVTGPGSTSFSPNVLTKVPMSTVTEGGSYFSTDTFTAPSAGLYLFEFEVRFDSSTTPLPVGKEFLICLSGSTAPTGGIVGSSVGSTVSTQPRTIVQVNSTLRLSAGQAICPYVWHNNTSNITLNTASLKVVKLY